MKARKSVARAPGDRDQEPDFTQVTEVWGLAASPEQVAMQYCRYKLAGDLSQGKSVLEVGCGCGMGLQYLHERAAEVIGGEFSPTLLAVARAHVSDLEIVKVDAHRLPFDNGRFDVVVMLEMLYYLSDVDRAFAEARRVLRPGGKVLVCVPNPERADFNPSPLAVRYFDSADLSKLFQRHGFAVTVFGGFPVGEGSPRDRFLRPIRELAVRFHVIPRSMHLKALVKRLIYGRTTVRLGAVREGMAVYPPLAEIQPDGRPHPGFKNLYAIGEVASEVPGSARSTMNA